jgi:hypothetical protein
MTSLVSFRQKITQNVKNIELIYVKNLTKYEKSINIIFVDGKRCINGEL